MVLCCAVCINEIMCSYLTSYYNGVITIHIYDYVCDMCHSNVLCGDVLSIVYHGCYCRVSEPPMNVLIQGLRGLTHKSIVGDYFVSSYYVFSLKCSLLLSGIKRPCSAI